MAFGLWSLVFDFCGYNLNFVWIKPLAERVKDQRPKTKVLQRTTDNGQLTVLLWDRPEPLSQKVDEPLLIFIAARSEAHGVADIISLIDNLRPY